MRSTPVLPLRSESQAQAVLILTEMSVVDLRCLTPKRPGDVGITADEDIWFGRFGRRSPGRRDSSVSRCCRSADMQTAAWLPLLLWRTCFPTMTAMPSSRGWWQNRHPSQSPRETQRQHTHTSHMHTCAHTVRGGQPSVGPCHLPRAESQLEREWHVENCFGFHWLRW